MGYEISIDDRQGIVEIRLLEAVPHSEHVKARDELLEICRVRNIHRILVDARGLVIRDRPSTMELFDFGSRGPIWQDARPSYSRGYFRETRPRENGCFSARPWRPTADLCPWRSMTSRKPGSGY